jgi:uncharacterized protein (TIGR03086 family)
MADTPTAPAERYRRVARGFSDRVAGVPEGGWDDPSPCEGWVARDIVAHVCSWVPGLLEAGAGITLPPGPDPQTDPASAWAFLDTHLQRLLDDPAVAGAVFDHPQAGQHTVADAICRFILGDVLIHTWDLAHATGQDESLDPDEVATMRTAVEPMLEVLVSSGHYGPRVVSDERFATLDPTGQLVALLGRAV